MKNNSSNFLSTLKSVILCKQTFIFVLIFFMAIFPSFAQQETITELDNWGTRILNIFSSTWVKALLVLALAIEALGVIFMGQQGGGGAMFKKFAPWIVGTIVLISASSITSFFVSDVDLSIGYVESESTEQNLESVDSNIYQLA